MWTRKELKDKGRKAMNMNYWKTVLVSLILLFVVGGTVGSGGASSAASSATVSSSRIHVQVPVDSDSQPGESDIPEFLHGLRQELGEYGTIALAVTVILIVLIILAVVILLHAFLLNPLEAGSSRFFLRNLNTRAEVRELAYCYDHGYLNTVKTIFLKDLYTILWGLLLIIPGIVKMYEYRMIPYILAENPEIPSKEVFARSKSLMKGQKWHAFVLDLSFIGWGILSLLTLGMVGIFYLNPYRNMTNAALYETLAYPSTPEIAEQ